MWQPAHERHAIERVTASFQFDAMLPTRLWQSLINKATTDIPRKGFNASNDEVEFNLNFGPGGVVPGGPLPPGVQVGPGPGIQIGVGPGIAFGPNGIVIGGGVPANSPPPGKIFRVVAGDEVREEVSLHRNRLVYATTIYDRWSVFRDRMNSVLGSFMDQALPVANLSLVKLEYWDRFVFRGSTEEADFSKLLNSKSKYVAGFCSDLHELWHSHIGFFADPGLAQKRLLNLNVDVIDLIEASEPSQERRSVGIYSMAQDTVTIDKGPSNLIEVLSTLDDMHSILKGMLTDVITEETAKQISLNA